MYYSDNYWKCRELCGESVADFIWWAKDVVAAIPILIPMAIFTCFAAAAIAIPIMVLACLLQILISSL